MPRIIVVAGPVLVEKGRVLLNKHGDTLFWKFCGGRVEDFSTTLEENARREAKEEAGIDLVFLDHPPFFLYTKKETPEGTVDVILVHFLAERRGEVLPGADIRACEWIDFQDLSKEDLAPNILPTLTHFGFLSEAGSAPRV